MYYVLAGGAAVVSGMCWGGHRHGPWMQRTCPDLFYTSTL
jgi:hypothetical protein